VIDAPIPAVKLYNKATATECNFTLLISIYIKDIFFKLWTCESKFFTILDLPANTLSSDLKPFPRLLWHHGGPTLTSPTSPRSTFPLSRGSCSLLHCRSWGQSQANGHRYRTQSSEP